MRLVSMKGNIPVSTQDAGTYGRITRARAASQCASGQLPPLGAPKQALKRTSRASTKRTASDENNGISEIDKGSLQHKKRAVLKDVTNVCCDSSTRSCVNAVKIECKRRPAIRSTTAHSVAAGQKNFQSKSLTLVVAAPKTETTTNSSKFIGDLLIQLDTKKAECRGDTSLANKNEGETSQPKCPLRKEKLKFSGNSTQSSDANYINIDSDLKNPQLCSLYAPDIYTNLRAAELLHRPAKNFMEDIQRDITQTMRGILVDWLVEVSEEYKLVSDTLYLTVHLIDRFLSLNYIERPRLQLLGITCMLISSKYEEICAPRIEEFCFITDNTYSREEVFISLANFALVLKMETELLKHFGYQIFTPTTQTFLRRFLRAAQACYMSPSLELEYLANYVSELTLAEYELLNYLPSMIAASAVFLAKWTLDRSCHPWNPTLEHYTAYKSSDLKPAVLALQALQLNTKGCPLNAIRTKYGQQKFKSVAALSSPALLETLFSDG